MAFLGRDADPDAANSTDEHGRGSKGRVTVWEQEGEGCTGNYEKYTTNDFALVNWLRGSEWVMYLDEIFIPLAK